MGLVTGVYRVGLWTSLGLGLLLMAVHGAERALERLPITDRTGRQVGLYTGSYALLIGVSDYAHWPDLPGVTQDIAQVRGALAAQGFEVTEVQDPTRSELNQAFSQFIYKYAQEPEHRILIYFAGHGYSATLSYGQDMGYIVPRDAPNPHRDRNGFLARAMDMQQIEVYARRIQSKHALFLFDSCFSGSIFAMTRAIPAHIGDKTAKPVRQFITAGGKDEEVPDESVFRHQFIAAIQGEADVDGDGYVTGTELGEFLHKQVMHYSAEKQHPQYGKLRDAYLDQGDFVFPVRKSPPPSLDPQPPPVGPDPAAEMWSVVRTSQAPADLEYFLKEFPNSPYAPSARVRLRQLQRQSSTTAQAGGEWRDPTTGMAFVYVPEGCYEMGCGSWTSGCEADEGPVHEVCVDGFWLGKYEVTQGEWRQVMGGNPSEFARSDRHPVESVSWEDAQAFARALSQRSDSEFGLPTEAEWEYACRSGGEQRKYPWGQEDPVCRRGARNGANFRDCDDRGIAAVGSYGANELGLYDMSGNVWEWVKDTYSSDAYRAHSRQNPIYTRESSSRVLRGGSWGDDPRAVRCAHRGLNSPVLRNVYLGFRLRRLP